jgi:hypothetical protein
MREKGRALVSRLGKEYLAWYDYILQRREHISASQGSEQ